MYSLLLLPLSLEKCYYVPLSPDAANLYSAAAYAQARSPLASFATLQPPTKTPSSSLDCVVIQLLCRLRRCVWACVCVCVCAELHIFSILRLNVIVVAGLLLQLLLRLCRNNFIWSCHFLLPLGCYCCCFIFIHNSTFLWAWTWVQFVLPHPPHHPLRDRPSCESRWY